MSDSIDKILKQLKGFAGSGVSVIAGSGNTASGSVTISGSAGYTGATGMGATAGYTHSNYYRQYSPEEMVEAFMVGWEKNDLLDERPIDEIAKEYLKNKFG